jgi:hypothetical protein
MGEGGGVRVWRGAKSYNDEKAWPSIIHSLLLSGLAPPSLPPPPLPSVSSTGDDTQEDCDNLLRERGEGGGAKTARKPSPL